MCSLRNVSRQSALDYSTVSRSEFASDYKKWTHGLPQLEPGLPPFQTLVEDINSGTPESGLCGWTSLGAIPANSSTDDLSSPVNGLINVQGPTELSDDILDGTEMFLEPFHDVWGLGLPKLLPLDEGDPFVSINTTPEAEGRRIIEDVCSKLNIPSDPTKWSKSDLHKWMRWTLRKLNYPATAFNPDDWQLDGSQICQLSVQQFDERLPGDGNFVCAHLEQWKQLGPRAFSPISSGSHLYTNGTLTCDSTTDVNYTILDSATSILEPSSTAQFLMHNNNNNNHTGAEKCCQRGCLLSQTSTQRRLAARSPGPLLSTSPVCSTRVPLARFTMDAPFVNPLNAAGCFNCETFQPTTIKTELVLPSYGGSSDDNRSADSWLCGGPATSTPAKFILEESDQRHVSQSLSWLAPPSIASPMTATHVAAGFRSPTRGRGGNKRTICLWQFLRELLLTPQSYQNWIRWLDRNRGIFKIEDSVRVAKLWGERKNRPAMNYDKLSRSIRQYYKKGIIQKTTNSKRLVYQFCPQYM